MSLRAWIADKYRKRGWPPAHAGGRFALLRDRNILRYFIAVALVGFAVDGGVYSVLLNLFLIRLHYGTEQIGLVLSAGQLTFALSCLPAGMLGQRYGTKRLIMAGLFMLTAGCLLLPVAAWSTPEWRMPLLIAGQIAIYLGMALFYVNTAPFMIEAVPSSQRTALFALQTALLSLAAFAGSLGGGILPPVLATSMALSSEAPVPYAYALIVAGVALIPAIVAMHGVHPKVVAEETAADPAAAGAPASSGRRSILHILLLIAVVRLLQVAGMAATTTYFNVYLDAALLVPTATIGLIVSLGRLLGVPAALATSWLTTRFGNRSTVLLSTIASAIAILPIALIPHLGAAAVSFVGLIGFSWIRYASSVVFFLELVPPRQRATVSGVTEMAGGLTFTALTFGGGYMIAILGYQSLFLTGATLTTLSALVFWLAFRDVRVRAADRERISG